LDEAADVLVERDVVSTVLALLEGLDRAEVGANGECESGPCAVAAGKVGAHIAGVTVLVTVVAAT